MNTSRCLCWLFPLFPTQPCHVLPTLAFFYVTRDGSHTWCRTCFSRLPENPLNSTHDKDDVGRNSGVGGIPSTSGRSSCRVGAIVGSAGANGHKTSQIPNRNISEQVVAPIKTTIKAPSPPPSPTGGEETHNTSQNAGSTATTNVAKRDLLKRRKSDTNNCQWVQCGTCDRCLHTVRIVAKIVLSLGSTLRVSEY